jgi:methyl-accepting chemotaxis protein PixJ
LLVAHQCSKPRQWQQYEIRWFSQIAMQVGFALDNAKALEQSILAYQAIENIFQQQSQQEELRQLATELLNDSEISFKVFSTKAMSLSESLGVALSQIQEVANGAKKMAITSELAEFQVQRNNKTLQDGQEIIKQTLESISTLQEAVTDGTTKVKQLSQHCQKLFDLTDFVCNITKQLNSENINAIAESELEDGKQKSVITNTQEVHALKKQLLEVIAEIQTLLPCIITVSSEMIETMETGSQQILNGTQSLQTTQQKLYRITTVGIQVNKVVEKITQAAANQAETSNLASQYVLSATNLAQQALEQSQALTKSFTKITAIGQEDTQKSGFWENIRRSFSSSRTFMALLTQQK